jgi:hypothetical protein
MTQRDRAEGRGLGDVSASELRPRRLRFGEEEKLLDLLEGAFGRWPAFDLPLPPIDHLRWKLRLDESDAPPHAVIDDGSRIVAAECMAVRPFKAGTRILSAFTGVDAAVQADYRNLGLYRRLQTYVHDELGADRDLYFGGIRSRAARRVIVSRSRRRQLANTVLVFERPLSLYARGAAAGGVPGVRRRLRRAAGYLIARMADLGTSRRAAVAPPFRRTEATGFDERMDAFWPRASAAFDFIGVRDAAYLNRRYADRRAGAYHVRLAEEGESVVGFGVLSVSRGRARVAELLALPGRLDVAAALLRDMTGAAAAAGAATLECWLPRRHPYRALLRHGGFFASGAVDFQYEPKLVRDDDVAFLSDPGLALHLTLGDTDLV